MKPEWLFYVERVRKEIDQMPAKKSGKNVERHLLSTWNEACKSKGYWGSLGDLEILMRRLGQDKIRGKGRRSDSHCRAASQLAAK